MKTRFYILLSLKTIQGFETFGQYFLGENDELANNLFNQLNGSRTLAENQPLHIDLMQTDEELPLKIKTITCTLDELADNCKLVTREIFKQKNLEGKKS